MFLQALFLNPATYRFVIGWRPFPRRHPENALQRDATGYGIANVTVERPEQIFGQRQSCVRWPMAHLFEDTAVVE
jgi:hypothetical protein